MENLKFIGWAIFGVTCAYLFLTILMPLFVSVTSDAAAEVALSPNAAEYVGAQEGALYFPLLIYFVPAVVGITAIVWKLKRGNKGI